MAPLAYLVEIPWCVIVGLPTPVNNWIMDILTKSNLRKLKDIFLINFAWWAKIIIYVFQEKIIIV